MFDTHCHLNFKAYRKILDQVIADAAEQGIKQILIPGTNVPTSQRAIEIANEHDGFYVAAGIHPHHVFELYARFSENEEETNAEITSQLLEIEKMLTEPKVIAVGELGLDRHMYVNTKYKEYTVTDEFLELQKRIMLSQMELAIKYEKTLIVHNREAGKDLLNMLEQNWSPYFQNRMVFHCCEASEALLQFAVNNAVFIGVDGDITYEGSEKMEFIKKVPHHMLVLETDGPYLLPEPLRTAKQYPNKPANLKLIADKVAEAWKMKVEEVIDITTENAEKLFHLN